MPKFLTVVAAKWAALTAGLYNLAAHIKTHTITALYLLTIAAVLIPVGDLVISFWKPTVVSYHKRFAAPAIEPAPVKKGRL